jgi:hypothetical protein
MINRLDYNRYGPIRVGAHFLTPGGALASALCCNTAFAASCDSQIVPASIDNFKSLQLFSDHAIATANEGCQLDTFCSGGACSPTAMRCVLITIQ